MAMKHEELQSVNGVAIKLTLCASCKHMWDGFGIPCPKDECSDNTLKCDSYKRMSDKDLLIFAPQFWDNTFFYWDGNHREWQPVRPLISELTPRQLTINFDQV